MNPRAIIQEPVITEKASMLREGNKYAFRVHPKANKLQIRQAVESIFSVKVESVRTIKVPSKPKRQGMYLGRRAGWKKAYVTLQAGDSIEFAEKHLAKLLSRWPFKKFRPTTPTLRYKTVNSFADLTRSKPEKSLLASAVGKSGGRNNQGRLTMRRRGGGHKRRYRVIDFKRAKIGVPGRVAAIEYDPNRSAFIALVVYADGDKRYILAPLGLKVGAEIAAGPNAPIQVGNALPLANIPLGATIHNVELNPGRGGQLARSAGAEVQLLGRDGGRAQLRLPSGENREVPVQCMATLGQVGNIEHANIVHWQGGSRSLVGAQTQGAGRSDESGRPPAWGRRGPVFGWTAPGHPLGQAD